MTYQSFRKNLNGAGCSKDLPRTPWNESRSILRHSLTWRYHCLLLLLPSVTFSAADPVWRDVWSKGPSHLICIPSLWLCSVMHWLHSNHQAFANWERQTIIWKCLLLCLVDCLFPFLQPQHIAKGLTHCGHLIKACWRIIFLIFCSMCDILTASVILWWHVTKDYPIHILEIIEGNFDPLNWTVLFYDSL